MRGQNSDLVRNAARASIASASTLLLATLLIMAGRLLGDAEYGKFSFALALVTIFEALVDFGLKEITAREVAREPRAAPFILANTFGLKLVLAVAAVMGLLLTVRVLRLEPDMQVACYLLGVASILRSYLLTIRHALQGLERFGLDSTSVVVDRLLLLFLGAGALSAGLGLLGIAASFVAARVVSLMVAYFLVARQVGPVRPAFNVKFWCVLQRQALPFGAFTVVFYLYSYIDMVMLGVLRGNAETGLYSGAYRIYEGIGIVPQMLQVVVIPRLARHFMTDSTAHGQLSRTGLAICVMLAMPVSAGTIMLAAPLVTLLFGAEYAAAGSALQVLAGGFIFVFPLFVLYAIALSVDAGGLLLRTALIGSLANIAMNLLLIPPYGMHGAAAATVAGEALSVSVLTWGLRRQIVPRPGVQKR